MNFRAPRDRKDCSSAAIAPALWLTLVCFSILAAVSYGAQPGWWTNRGAVMTPEITTNNGVVTTNYIPNDYAVVVQGQLKFFTQKAVQELNANLTTSGGAGTNLNTLVSNWISDYSLHGYATNSANPARPYKPEDLQAVNVGQLKYVGRMIWTQLIADGYTNAPPSWLHQNTNTDNSVALVGQLKSVFNFEVTNMTNHFGIIPNLALVSGNDQTNAPGTFAPLPLTIAVSNSDGSGAVTNAGVTFSVQWGGGGVASTFGGTTNSSLPIFTDSGGHAQVYLRQGATQGVTKVAATLGGKTVEFNEKAIDSAPSDIPHITSAATVMTQVNASFNYTIIASNGPASYAASPLPAGLSLDSTTGVISGTPTTVGITDLTLTATNSTGIGALVLVIEVVANLQPPVIDSSGVALATVGSSFAYEIAASNMPTHFAATGLPFGLAIDAATGIISGTPSTAGTYTVSLSASNSAGTGAKVLMLQINSPFVSGGQPNITSSLTSSGTAGLSFGYSIVADHTPTSYGAIGLPASLSLDTASGQISGVPGSGGTTSVVISASNALGTTSTILVLTIADTTPSITSRPTANGTVGTSFKYVVSATSSPTSFSITPLSTGGTTLASLGLTFDATSGTISGAPTSAGSYTFTLGATNSVGVGTAALTLNLGPRGLPTFAVPHSPIPVPSGSLFSYPYFAIAGVTTYSATGLPSGLTMDTTTGVISGKTTAIGTHTATLSAANTVGSASAPVTFIVTNPIEAPVFTSPNLGYATVGSTFSYSTAILNGPATFSATGLPAGVTIDSSSGQISGMPNPGSSDTDTPVVTIRASNVVGTTTFSLRLIIQPDAAHATSMTTQLVLQAGVSPFSDYKTASAGIRTDTVASSLTDHAFNDLKVGRSTATDTSNETDRSLLGFDLSVVPPGATITSASLKLYIDSISGPTSTSYAINVCAGDASLTQLTDLSNASWTNNNGGDFPTVLSSLSTSLPWSAPAKIWPSTSAFVSVAQTALTLGKPLFLLLESPDLEGLTVPIYLSFNNEQVPLPDSGGSSSRPALLLTYTSAVPPVMIDSYPVPAASGSTFSYQVPFLYVDSSVVYSATGLPDGLSIDSETGAITGTPSTPGTYTGTISATTGNGKGTSTLTLNVAPKITSPATAPAQINTPFSYTITSNNTSDPHPNYSVSYLPAGLVLDRVTGIISGSPTQATPYPVDVTLGITTTYGAATANLEINFAPAISVPLTTAIGNQGSPFGYEVQTTGVAQGFTATGLPDGLSINSQGFITGTPTATTSGFGTQATITVSGPGGSASGPLTIVILPSPTPVVPAQSIGAVSGVPFAYLVQANVVLGTNSSGTIVPVFAISSPDQLPAGLAMDAGGNISGTPTDTVTEVTSHTVHITATNGSNVGSGVVTITLYPTAPGIGSPLALTVGTGDYVDYDFLLLFWDDIDNFNTVSATNVPDPLHFSAEAQNITGLAPPIPGSYSINLGLIDFAVSDGGDGLESDGTLVLTVTGITSASTATGSVGASFDFQVADNYHPVYFEASNLPLGLKINHLTGEISGTPAVVGTTAVNLSVVDGSSLGFGNSRNGTLLITAAASSSDTVERLQQGVSPASTYVISSANIAYDGSDVSVQRNPVTPTGVLTVGATGNYASSNSLLGFDLSSLPYNAVITSASLVLTPSAADSAGTHDLSLNLFAADSFDPTTATWDNNGVSNWDPLGTVSVNPAFLPSTVAFVPNAALTQTVQQALVRSGKVYFELANLTYISVPSYVGFYSPSSIPTQNPVLVVTYELGPAATPIITSPSSVNVDAGTAFTYTLTDSNISISTAVTGYTFTEPDGSQSSFITGLPPGLTFTDNGRSGILGGTLTGPGTYTITLAATNSHGTGTASLVVKAPGLLSPGSATAWVGQSFNFAIVDNDTPTLFSAQNLPSTLTLDKNGGTITGTPAAADTLRIPLTVQDASGTRSSTLLLSIKPDPTNASMSFQQAVSPTGDYAVPSAVIEYDSQDSTIAGQSFTTGQTLTVGKISATAMGRAMLDFDLSALPTNATITSASLVMNSSVNGTQGTPPAIEVHQANAAFPSSTANWINNGGYGGAILSSSTLSFSAPSAIKTFPVTPAFTQAAQQAFIQGTHLYLSLVAPDAESGSAVNSAGFVTNGTDPTQDPQLIITYKTDGPAKPVITSSPVVTGTANSPLTYTITARNNPTSFSATGLPPGLLLTPNSGTITGTVTNICSTVAEVGATNAAGVGSQNVTFNIDNTNPATTLDVVSGYDQVGLAGTFLPQPIVVRAVNNGTPPQHVLVTFTVPAGHGGLAVNNTGSPASANSLTVATDGDGNASVYFQLPSGVGTSTITISAGTATPATVHETSVLNTSAPADSVVILSVISGEGQSAPAGSGLLAPFVVQAVNSLGQAAARLPLSLQVQGGGGTILNASGGILGSSSTLSTDNFGQAKIFLEAGGGPSNKVSCTATVGSSSATVYLVAQTAAASDPTVTSGGGTPPGLDSDPYGGATPGLGFTLSLGGLPGPFTPDLGSVYLTWTALGSGATYHLLEKSDYSDEWADQGAVTSGHQVTGLVSGHDYQFEVQAYDSDQDIIGTTNICSCSLALVKGFYGSATGFGVQNIYPDLVTPTSADAKDLYNKALDFYYNNSWQGTYALPLFLSTNDTSTTAITGGSGWSAPAEIGQPSAGREMAGGKDDINIPHVGGGWSACSFQFEFNPNDSSEPSVDWYQVHSRGPFFTYYDSDSNSDSGSGSGSDSDSSVTTTYTYTPMSTEVSGDKSPPILFESSASDTSSSESDELVPGIHLLAHDGYGSGILSDDDASGSGLDLTVGDTADISMDTIGSVGPMINEDNPATVSYDSTLITVFDSSGNLIESGTQETSSIGGLTIIPNADAADGSSASLTVATDNFGSSTVNFTIHNPPSDDSTSLSMPLDEASGSRYRKIGLNGVPMSDEKPQQSAESDQEKEETYVDALTLGLRHSTTDIYIPVPGSDFSVSARRDLRSQVWENTNGLRPHEQPDLPFGICWSSNLAPNIKVIRNNDPSSTTPEQAIVTDEAGAVHTFFRTYDSKGASQFIPMPTAKNEAQVPNLETLTADTAADPPTFAFQRKYGATLTYEVTKFSQAVSNARLASSKYSTSYSYARLTQAVDRAGNHLYCHFDGDSNLIPDHIWANQVSPPTTSQSAIQLWIQQQPVSALGLGLDGTQSVITAIWDANKNKTSFTYVVATGDAQAVQLDTVTAPDGNTTKYTYSVDGEPDQTPQPPNTIIGTFTYVDLASIKDPLQNIYGFTYNIDHSKKNYMADPKVKTGYYTQTGDPRNIAVVTMPDNSSSHPDTATFVNENNPLDNGANPPIFLSKIGSGTDFGLTVSGPHITQVTDANLCVHTYSFQKPTVVRMPSFPQKGGNIAATEIVAYQELNITYGSLGSETFEFDIQAAMALSGIADLCGNITSFNHETGANHWTAPPAYADLKKIGATINGYYDDPVSQTDASGTKSFTYDTNTRIMSDIVDQNGNKTHYSIDFKGRRTAETVSDPQSHVVQETKFAYDNANFPGFMTDKTVVGPSSTSLETSYTADANGRVQTETVDPNGTPLSSQYTYDANGNKLTATDPKGQTTWFSYDSRNRLTTVTYADGTQKYMFYDARGNKRLEYDENNFGTIYGYDSLNRLTSQARDMNGNGQADSGIDLITLFAYDNANSKVKITAPGGGVTTMQYDDLQRLTDLYTNADVSTQYHTHYDYVKNCGGNAFDSSSFKPTKITGPQAGISTDIAYDAVYRPTDKDVHYDALHPANVSHTHTEYDGDGNVKSVLDPVGNLTTTFYDALNRPTKVIAADGALTTTTYTPTGLKYQVQQQVRTASGQPVWETTTTAYDGAARPTDVSGSLVDDGYGGTASPDVHTDYDLAGNVARTSVLIHGTDQEITDFAYDARNRKVQQYSPAVLDDDSASPTYGEFIRPTTTWQYDPAGRTIHTFDPKNQETTTDYDVANRVTFVHFPPIPVAGQAGLIETSIQNEYDLDGNVTYAHDANGHTTHNFYDLLRRLTASTDAAGLTVTNTYDEAGNKLSVQDGNLHTTWFTYDGLSRNTSSTDAAGYSSYLIYNGLNKTQRIDTKGQVTSYLYDQRNRLQYVVYNSTAAANARRTYAYDFAGNLLCVKETGRPEAKVEYGYDLLNRVVSETSNGVTHTYRYDLAGNRLQTAYGSGRTITSTYDDLNRLDTMTEGGRSTGYGYDLNGNIAEKTLPNGDTETSTFDALNRASEQVGASGNGSPLYDFAYGYDRAGNVVTVGENYPSGLNNRTVTNTYDDINRLHLETVTGTAPNSVTRYEYDNNNNRTDKIITGTGASSTHYNYNALNELCDYSDGNRHVALHYDLNGNRCDRKVTGGSDNGTDTYGYDFENRLISVVKGTLGGGGAYAYEYDYRTRRITRDESSAGGTITHVVFSGGTSEAEYDGLAITATSPTVENIRGSDYGGGVGGILYTLRGGTPSYTHENKRGDVIAKTDASGSLTYQAQYEAFGKQTATSGSTLDRQKSNSKDTDPTGLVDEGFRYRDLETGMFINRDPAGFVDGPNLYTYVVQNPWTKFDPEGLTAAEFASDLGHQLAANTVGLGRGFVNSAAGLGQTIVNVSVGAANATANAAASTVNGKLADACSSLRQNSGNIGPALYQDTVGAAGTAFTNIGKNIVATAGKDGGGGELCGDLVAAVVTGKICSTPPEAPGGVSAKTTCGSPTTCFTAGTLVLEDGGEIPIEDVQVGDRVLSQDAAHQESTTEVDPRSWKEVKLRVENADNISDPLTVDALRSPAWIKASGAKLGGRIWFDAEDVGVKGWATVEDVKPCPPISSNRGRVVLTTLTHLNNDLYLLQINRLKHPLETTGLHRIYSVTQHNWVHARNLRVGELLQTYRGNRTVTGISPESGARRVYNFEVETDHTYFVSKAQVLVHNAGCGGEGNYKTVDGQTLEAEDLQAGHLNVVETGNYTNTHASGTQYHGAGSADRAAESGDEKAFLHDDPLVSTDHEAAPSHREAMKGEDRRIEAGGGVKSPNNFNKINSPGSKMRQEDGEK